MHTYADANHVTGSGMMVANTRGIALVSSLLVLVILVGLGASALFLAQMNAKNTENVYSQAIAQNAAETGMDIARLSLQQHFRDAGHYPVSYSLPAVDLAGMQSPFAYSVVPGSYIPQGDHVEIAVVGAGPNGAQFTSRARMVAEYDLGSPGAEGYTDGFPGFLSESTVKLSGNGATL